MKVRIILYLFFWGTLTFSGIAQHSALDKKVSLTYHEVTLEEVLLDLGKKHHLNFTYFNNIPLKRMINIDVQKVTLGSALAIIFNKAGLKYAVTQHSVVIQQKFKQFTVAGRITDRETGDPLAFAAVSIKNKSMGIVSKTNGEFGFIIPERYKNDTLFVSMLGYKNYEIDIANLDSDDDLKIVLDPQSKYLDEIDVASKNSFVDPISTQRVPTKIGGFLLGSYATHAHYSMSAKNLSLLIINCGAGSLTVVSNTTSDSIIVDAEILTTSISQKESEKYIENYLRLFVEETRDTARINSFFKLMKEDKNGRIRMTTGNALTTPVSKINLTIKVPANLKLTIDDNSGELFIKELENDIYLVDGSGEISIEKVKGKLDIEDGSGGMTLRDISGNVSIEDASGEIEIRNVMGSLTIRDASGGITLKKVKPKVGNTNHIYIRDRSGKIDAIQLVGDVELQDSSGRIVLSNVKGKVTVTDSSGRIVVNELNGTYDLNDSNGRAIINGKEVK